MTQSFYAIYENGVLRPISPVACGEGEIVTLEVTVIEESLASELLRTYKNDLKISDDDTKSSTT